MGQTHRKYLPIGVLVCLAGCVATGSDEAAELPTEPDVVDPVEIETPVIVEMPAPDPVPGECEILLESLREIRPLLDGLDESLVAQSDRIDAAIAEMKRPAPVAPAPVCPPETNGPLGAKDTVGATEWVHLDPPGRHYRARIDSGAETSSLSASDIVEFERDGDDWVRFVVQDDSDADAVELELPIQRTVLVRQLSSDQSERRFVVDLDIRLGQQLHTTEFTLADRGRMRYPVALGRAFLLDLFVIDVSRSYIHERFDASE